MEGNWLFLIFLLVPSLNWALSTTTEEISTYKLFFSQNISSRSFSSLWQDESLLYERRSPSKWQTKIRIKDSRVINLITLFNPDSSSLYERRLSSNCESVTWIVEKDDIYFGQVTCFWSMKSFDHCGTFCKFPIISEIQNQSDLSYLNYLSTLAAAASSIEFNDEESNILLLTVHYSLLPLTLPVSSISSLSPFTTPSSSLLDNSRQLQVSSRSSSSSSYSSSSSSSSSSTSSPATRPWTFSSPQKLFSPNGQSYDNFGVSVGYHNDVAIVGAVTRDYGGRVYIYYREGNNFIQDPLLLTGYPPSTAPTISASSSSPPTTATTTHDYFGWSIDIYDRTIAVGAYHTLELTTEVQSVGAVYIYFQLTSGWNIESFLRLHTPQQVNGKDNRNPVEVTITPKYDQFGWSLGLDDSHLIVGAYGDDDQGTSSGAVYAFERINGMRYHWTVTQKLLPSDGSNYDNFGWSVAIDRNMSVIGAYGDRTQNQPYSGSVYIYKRCDSFFSSSSSSSFSYSTWTQIQKLVPFDSYSSGFYGWSVDIWGDVLAVGSKSSGDSSTATTSGNGVYIYRNINSNWKIETKLTPPNNRIIPNFGTSVSLDEDTILIGAYRDLIGSSPSSPPSSTETIQSGSAFVYTSQYQEKDKSTSWILLKELNSNSTVERYMKFGSSVKIFDDILMIGATLGDGMMIDTGTVFVFVRSLDYSALGHPLSGGTYYTLVIFLPLLFLGTCFVITFARIFMKPEDHSTSGSGSGSSCSGGSSHENDDSTHSTSNIYNPSKYLYPDDSAHSSRSGSGLSVIHDDEESVHSLSGLLTHQFIRSSQFQSNSPKK